MKIVDRLCKEYGPYDDKRQCQKLFHQIYKIDVMDDIWLWTEGDPAIKSRSLDAIRELMGLSKDNAHDALQDVKDTANIFIKLQKSRRAIYQNMEFANAFSNGKTVRLIKERTWTTVTLKLGPYTKTDLPRGCFN